MVFRSAPGAEPLIKLAAPFLATVVGLSACDGSATNSFVQPPPPEVDVARPLVKTVMDYLDFTGTTAASSRVQVRARVSGILEKMLFAPGTEVAADQSLFIIDPREYEADLNGAEAELASARAQHDQASTELERAERLFKEQAGSETVVVEWRAQKELAEAAMQRASASIQRARLNLDYTNVTTPIAGRVGRNQVDVGALVGASEPTVLTDVTRYDPMYVYFDINERDLLRLMAIHQENVRSQGLDTAREPISKLEIKMLMGLANEEGFPHEGILDFAESGLDTSTGTMRLRASFPNPGDPPDLIPGLFTRIRFPVGQKPDTPLVTERAIGADQSGRFVLVVDDENTVEKRNVRVGLVENGLRVIEEGLRPEERVVVSGLLRARPGAVVAPNEVDMASMSRTALANPAASN